MNLEPFIAVFLKCERNQNIRTDGYHGNLCILFATLAFLKDSHMSCGYSFQVYVSFLTWEWEE